MKKKAPVETPPNCAICDERPADGSLYVSYSPFTELRESMKPRRYDEPAPINRGWSLHLPACVACIRASVSVGVKMDLKNDKGTWAHVSPEVPK